jgi:Ca2+-binding RTX toxin-like protein
VIIDLTAEEAQSSTIGLDAIAQFEHALGTDQDDTLIGNSANNILLGFGGADHIEGHDGDDRLDGSDGIDFLDGGDGTDTCVGETALNCEITALHRTGR